ncbi:hypothetical protein HHK36_016286 [Tetracentron sinense]|uniref:Glycosyltransferase n=1 Tax=Tetracentron sinense TaxID=13715 RepID=A0A834Z379_TETSI|nr:hypothetical protein HHK36_016286 [Tetracentron sinense]
MEQQSVPHLLLLPFPAQGHISPMLKLAELLYQAGFHITFLNTPHNHDRHLRFTDLQSRFTSSPRFRFQTIPDGLPPDHPRSVQLIRDIFFSTQLVTKPLLRDLLLSFPQDLPVTGIIADGIMTFAIDVAQDLGIPIFIFRTCSACAFWAYRCIPKLIEAGDLPFEDHDDMDRPINSVPGMETLLRRRDLPSICRLKDLENPVLQFFVNETFNIARASGLILNTFDDLEAPILSHIGPHFPQLYTIGPIHTLLKTRQGDTPPSVASNGSLWEEDGNCMAWLESKPLKSVLYVSFGSIVSVTRDELLEFWYGLVNSGKPFLWVIRQDLIAGKEGKEGEIPAELEGGTKERGCVVGWAPQEEVLAHPAVGGFLTHSGWNSTLESIIAGVPMICWPQLADQQINSRFVSEVWRNGIDMKDRCDRVTVEKMVRDLMVDQREELEKAADKMADLARKCVREGGSSCCNFERLIEDIRSMMS